MPFIRSSSAWGELSSVSSLGQYRSGPLVLEDAALCSAPATFSLHALTSAITASSRSFQVDVPIVV
jgi:hypothetical protein